MAIKQGYIDHVCLSVNGSMKVINGKITKDGIDVVEGKTSISNPINIHNNNISIGHASESSNIVVNNHNQINMIQTLENLKSIIDSSSVSDEDKVEAKSMFKKLLKHPIIIAILGGISGSLPDIFK